LKYSVLLTTPRLLYTPSNDCKAVKGNNSIQNVGTQIQSTEIVQSTKKTGTSHHPTTAKQSKVNNPVRSAGIPARSAGTPAQSARIPARSAGIPAQSVETPAQSAGTQKQHEVQRYKYEVSRRQEPKARGHT